MTLQEAHEIQRRELISLRAENKRLQKQASGLFSSEDREALERRIRHLEQINKTEAARHEAAREHWKLTDKRCFELELEILTDCETFCHAFKLGAKNMLDVLTAGQMKEI